MAINKVEIIVTNQDGKSISVDILDFPFRLNRNCFDVSEDRLKILGGTYSTQIRLAKSKKNNQLFKQNDWKSHGKFTHNKNFQAVLLENGSQIVKGTLKIERFSKTSIDCTFYSEDVDWLDKLSNVQLNKLGYVDGRPTWLIPFDGAASFDVINESNNRETDILFPTIVFNNTPIADYLDLTDDDIWGQFETNPSPPPALTRLTDGGVYPNNFKLIHGYFGDRLGLTFQDFPPAVYYRNLIEKIFAEIDMNVDCSLFNEDWFNALYVPYSGDGYQYNWKNLASVRSQVLAKTINGLDVLLPPSTDNGLTMFDDVYSTTNYDDPLLPVLAGNPSSHNQWLIDGEPFFKVIQTFGSQDFLSPYYVDKITCINPFQLDNQYIVPADGSYTIHIGTGIISSYDDFITKFSPGNTRYDGKTLFQSYAGKDANSGNVLPQADKHYGYDDNVFIILRQNENNDFVFSDTMDMLMEWMAGQNKDFINNPSDVVAYISPKRWVHYDNGDITDYKEAYGSPLTNWENEVVVGQGSYPPIHVITTPSTALNSESYADISITLDLRKNERLTGFWINLGNIQGTNASLTQGLIFEKYALETTYASIGDGAGYPDIEEQFHVITHNCGEYDLDIAKNLPSISAKTFINSFVKQFNLYFQVENNTIRFLPYNEWRSNISYDITSRVVDGSWICEPVLSDDDVSWEIAYDNDTTDRLLNEEISTCVYDETKTTNYGNVVLSNDVSDTSVDVNTGEMSIFSATKFVRGHIDVQDMAIIAMTFPTSTDPESGIEILKGIDFTYAPIDFQMDVPSIQTSQSFAQETVGELEYNYNYKPRLLYHLGTIYTYLNYNSNYFCLIDSPRNDSDFVKLQKHWFRPTVSAFDFENGNIYPTLRYDTENGLFNRYFENLVDLYNESEVLTLQVALRSRDWVNLTGSKRVRYQDQLYRLMSISDYSPLDNTPCTIKLLKEI